VIDYLRNDSEKLWNIYVDDVEIGHTDWGVGSVGVLKKMLKKSLVTPSDF